MFNDTIFLEFFANKRGVSLPRLVLVPKRQPGIQMDLHRSDLPEEVQKLVKENSLKKAVFHAKTEYGTANYIVEMHGKLYLQVILNTRSFMVQKIR